MDNDKAGRDVVSYAQGIAKNQGLPVIAGLNYVFTRPNLYVVRIQSPANGPNCVIEQLFPDQLLKTKLGSKVLTLSNHKVGDNEYGKMYFAKHVIPNADPKDFLGFTQLLDILVEIMADFSSRVQVEPAVKKA